MMPRMNFALYNANTSRNMSFHARYLDLCRLKNVLPLAVVRGKHNNIDTLDIFGDKLLFNDWLLITNALEYDTVLLTLGIKLRKCVGSVVDYIDTDLKAKRFKQKPVIYTKFVFTMILNSISKCLYHNKNITVLKLEALPLTIKYIELIIKFISQSKSLKELSFQRSPIGDNGCEILCGTLKYMDNIEKINFSECNLTENGAEFVADLIKLKRIKRFSEAWQNSLRYRAINKNNSSGLSWLALARNPKIGDSGLKMIVEILKEDSWITHVDFENCGLTDVSANLILECLNVNTTILMFKITGNPGIGKPAIRKINERLQMDEFERNNVIKSNIQDKATKLHENIKRIKEKLALEKNMRKKAEKLNEKLSKQIESYKAQLNEEEGNPTTITYEYIKDDLPEGYVIINFQALKSIVKEHNDLRDIADIITQTREITPRLHLEVRDKQKSIMSITTSIDAPQETTKDVQYNSPRISTNNEPQKKLLNVRNIKSEVKYIEPKEPLAKKYSKSDYQLLDEYLQAGKTITLEANIGDSALNNSKNNNRIIANSEKILKSKIMETEKEIDTKKPLQQQQQIEQQEQQQKYQQNQQYQKHQQNQQLQQCQQYQQSQDTDIEELKINSARTLNSDFEEIDHQKHQQYQQHQQRQQQQQQHQKHQHQQLQRLHQQLRQQQQYQQLQQHQQLQHQQQQQQYQQSQDTDIEELKINTARTLNSDFDEIDKKNLVEQQRHWQREDYGNYFSAKLLPAKTNLNKNCVSAKILKKKTHFQNDEFQ